MTRFAPCLKACCFATGKCCGCCGKTAISDPAVRALSDDLNSTFRRMRAIEARHADSIATLEPQEADHEHQLAPDTEAPDSLAAGTCPTRCQPHPTNAVTQAIETLRRMHA